MSPDQYEIDDDLMDELGGAMDDFDGKRLKPVVIEIAIHAQGKDAAPKSEEGSAEPTEEELEEMLKEC